MTAATEQPDYNLADIKQFLDRAFPQYPEDEHVFLQIAKRAPAGVSNCFTPPELEEQKLNRKKVPMKAYFLASTVHLTDGELRALKSAFAAFRVLVLDDVGTKVPLDKIPEDLVENYKIESSPGNFQLGFVLANPITDYNEAQALIDLFVNAGLTDAGGAMPCKKVRLPCGVHGTKKVEGVDFQVNLINDSKEPWDTQELLDAAQIDVNWEEYRKAVPQRKPRKRANSTREAVEPCESDDVVLTWLYEQDMVVDDTGENFVTILCPWADKHSEGGEEVAGYSPLGAGTHPDIRGFNCFHSHGKEHKTTQFLEYVAEQGGPEETPTGYHQDITDIATSIATRLREMLGGDVCVDYEKVNQIVEASFWSDQKAKFHFHNRKHDLVRFPEKGITSNLRVTFGCVVDTDEIRERVVAALAQDTEATPADHKAMERKAINASFYPILDHIRLYRQREHTRVRVDMFTDVGYTRLMPDSVDVVFPHSPYVVPDTWREDVVDDFKAHFPLFDEFIDLLAAARFSADRKKAYLWMHCDSDWGKGLLLDIFEEKMNIATPLSVKEVEKMMEKQPVPKTIREFKHSIVLTIDEFKTVRSELKQLQNVVSFSPKHTAEVDVEVYTKLFTSAEHILSLVGERGVEDQFTNRFSYYRGKGSIEHRPVFKEVGAVGYQRSLWAYMAERLNQLIAEYQAKGREDASNAGMAVVGAFHAKHGLGQYFDTLSKTRDSAAADVVEWIVKQKCKQVMQGTMDARIRDMMEEHVIQGDNGEWFLRSAAMVVGKWVETQVAHEEQATLGRKKTEYYEAMSEDGGGYRTHLLRKHTRVRAIKLKVSAKQSRMMRGLVAVPKPNEKS